MNVFTFFRLASAFLFILITQTAFAGAYAQLESHKNQPPVSPKPQLAVLEVADTAQGITKNDQSTQFTVKEDGSYFILASAQIGTQQQVTPNGYNGSVDLWLTKNGKIIPGSPSRQYIVNVNNTAIVLVSETITDLKAGDVISIYFASTNSALGLVTLSSPYDKTPIPSISLSMFKV
jgi:hypothetical protein